MPEWTRMFPALNSFRTDEPPLYSEHITIASEAVLGMAILSLGGFHLPASPIHLAAVCAVLSPFGHNPSVTWHLFLQHLEQCRYNHRCSMFSGDFFRLVHYLSCFSLDFRLGIIQLQVSTIKAENLNRACGFVRTAAAQGAKLVVLPVSICECFSMH